MLSTLSAGQSPSHKQQANSKFLRGEPSTKRKEFSKGIDKQIKEILFQGDEVKDSELHKFALDFYQRLNDANLRRETFDREQENRRLDAFTRLIVGDETCAAAAFSRNKLLVSTNENDHDNYQINIEIKAIVRPGIQVNEYILQPVYYISYTGHTGGTDVVPTRILGSTKTKYVLTDSGLQATTSPETKTIISASEHLIPYLGDLPINAGVTLHALIRLSADDIEGMKSDLDVVGQREVATDNIQTVQYNRLLGASEAVMSHMALLSSLTQKSKYATENAESLRVEKQEILEKFVKWTHQLAQDLLNNRAALLKNSLAWEASNWYEKHLHPRDYKDSSKSGIDTFITALSQDFNAFQEETSDLPLMRLIETWIPHITQKVLTREIEAPSYILDTTKPEAKYTRAVNIFFDKAKRYFTDIVKLEEFFIETMKDPSSAGYAFAQNIVRILDETRGDSREIARQAIEVVNDLDNNAHAELRILYRLFEDRPEYIATSLLCCAFCKLTMDSQKVEDISGTHARAYSGWVLPRELVEKEGFLQAFLGDALYAKYLELGAKSFSFRGADGNKGKIALEIIQEIAGIQDVLKKRGDVERVIFERGSTLAEESDDEEEEEGASASITVHNITSLAAQMKKLLASTEESTKVVAVEELPIETKLTNTETIGDHDHFE